MTQKKITSRTAPKFVVRLRDEEQRAKIESMADQQASSMNAVIIQAIDDKLERGEAIDRLLHVASIFVGWQPFSTCPQNVDVLFYREDCGVINGRLCDYDHFMDDKERDTTEITEDEQYTVRAWCYGPKGVEMLDGDLEPTSWMAMPPGPREAWRAFQCA